jgi:DNA (cytosine-5)-methyltransferase 1
MANGIIAHNCTDLSKAGKQAGLSGGTRSGLVYEVIRLLKATTNKPKVLIMENVVDLVQVNFIKQFNEIQREIELLGYTNYTEVLNAKDYGVAQNRQRVFMVSILGEHYYEFPQPFPLTKRLKDYLEPQVDEKYYLSDKAITGLQRQETKDHHPTYLDDGSTAPTIDFRVGDSTHFSPYIMSAEDCGRTVRAGGGSSLDRHSWDVIQVVGNLGNAYKEDGIVYGSNGIAPTLKARDYKTPKNIQEPILDQVAQLDGFESTGRIYSKDGLCPTINTMGGGQREPKIAEPNLKEQMCNKLIKNGKVKEYDVIRHSYSNSRMDGKMNDIQENNMSPTIDTRADCLGVVTRFPLKFLDRNQKNIEGDYAFTVDTMQTGGVQETTSNGLRIRKLTPLECWRLMGISDEDFHKAKAVVSDSQLYKQAGNGIVVDVFMAVLRPLF